MNAKPEHVAAMLKMHNAAAEFFAAEIAKLSDRQVGGAKHKKLRADCVAAMTLADAARAELKAVA